MKNKTKLLIVIIVIAVYLVVTTIVVGTLFGNCGVATKKDYDMSKVVFEDLTVEYDGQPHSVLATNLPEGVSASYENNNQTEIGTYTVTAHFYGDEERYNPIPDKTAVLKVTKPAKNRILSATGFEIDETSEPPRIYCDVPNTTEHIDLSDKITVMPNRTWKLYKDFDGEEEITSKTMSLETGHNIAYIIITDLINNTSTYEVDVYRLDMKSYIFKNEGLVHASGLIEEKSQLASPEIPEKSYYTFTGWAVEGSTDIVKFPYTVTEDITFVAQYKPTEYKITYHLDGGINNEGNPEYYNIESSDIELLPASREGYSFDGWYEDRDYGTQITVIEHGSHGSKELYAKWAYGSEGLIYEQVGNEYKVAGYKGNDREIVVPNSWKDLPVTEIGKGVFENCTRLEKLTLPFVGANKDGTSYGHIGYIFGAVQRTESADFVPSSLKTVIITGGSTIDYGAFMYCASLESISIPESVTKVGNFAFEYCTNLTSVEFGENSQLASISCGMFEKCSSLKSIKVPDSVTYINDNAFEYCTSLESITFGENSQLNYIGELVFDACTNLKSIKIPDGVLYLGGYAFGLCTSLESVIFGEKSQLKYIDCWAFSGCSSLKSIKIPDSVTLIDMYAFDGCTSLEEITLPFVGGSTDGKTATHFGYIFGAPSYTDNAKYVPTSLKTVTITGGSTIYYSAFEGCASIESITLPDSLTEIKPEAFMYCSSLKHITIPDGVSSLYYGTFSGCTSLKSIEIPKSLNSIGGNLFRSCTSLNAVYITDIASWCDIFFFDVESNPLYNAKNLYLNNTLITTLEIPSSVTSIGSYAFYNCINLKSVTFDRNSEATSIGGSAFYGCMSLSSIMLPENLKSIGSNAFYNTAFYNNENNWVNKVLYLDNYLIEAKTDISGSYTVNSGTTLIAGDAFYECENLESIKIPYGVTFIGYYAFYGCTSLSNIDIPSGVATIGASAFYNCTSLLSIDIPSSVTSIGNSAFYNCKSLEIVTFGENSQLTSIKVGMFHKCTNLKSIEIPDSVTQIGNAAFDLCENLKSVTFGENSKLTYIGAAFCGCTSLESIVIPAGVNYIHCAFVDCENLKSVIFKNTHGWTAGDTAISSEDLEDPATAAEYLKGTYSDYDWRRAESE